MGVLLSSGNLVEPLFLTESLVKGSSIIPLFTLKSRKGIGASLLVSSTLFGQSKGRGSSLLVVLGTCTLLSEEFSICRTSILDLNRKINTLC